MTTTTYSESIKGARGNYHWPVRFDNSGGYIGITQTEDGKVRDRVLLSPNQVEELIAFVALPKKRRSR